MSHGIFLEWVLLSWTIWLPAVPGLQFPPQWLGGKGGTKVGDLRLIGSDWGLCPSLKLSLGSRIHCLGLGHMPIYGSVGRKVPCLKCMDWWNGKEEFFLKWPYPMSSHPQIVSLQKEREIWPGTVSGVTLMFTKYVCLWSQTHTFHCTMH